MIKKIARTIIPIYVAGRNSRFFYNFANLRKRLHIKGNIEMLYLVDEMKDGNPRVFDPNADLKLLTSHFG